MAPEPVIVVVPELVRVVIDDAPAIFNVPEFVNNPVPPNEVETVSVPLFDNEPGLVIVRSVPQVKTPLFE